MKNSPKTIQIFLPLRDPRTIRVPRSLVADFLKMPEAGQVGIDFLCGESDDGDVLRR